MRARFKRSGGGNLGRVRAPPAGGTRPLSAKIHFPQKTPKGPKPGISEVDFGNMRVLSFPKDSLPGSSEDLGGTAWQCYGFEFPYSSPTWNL